MPTVSFDGETHDEIVAQVRTWLASVDAGQTTLADVVSQQAEITKDALRIVAESAPGPIAENEVVQALAHMGYKATDATRDAALSALETLESATGGSVVKNVAEQGAKAMFKMNKTLATQFLKAVTND